MWSERWAHVTITTTRRWRWGSSTSTPRIRGFQLDPRTRSRTRRASWMACVALHRQRRTSSCEPSLTPCVDDSLLGRQTGKGHRRKGERKVSRERVRGCRY